MTAFKRNSAYLLDVRRYYFISLLVFISTWYVKRKKKNSVLNTIKILKY
jgi:hypothetical protein